MASVQLSLVYADLLDHKDTAAVRHSRRPLDIHQIHLVALTAHMAQEVVDRIPLLIAKEGDNFEVPLRLVDPVDIEVRSYFSIMLTENKRNLYLIAGPDLNGSGFRA
jgi:hypothetical protein